jgi:hypothetical protein
MLGPVSSMDKHSCGRVGELDGGAHQVLDHLAQPQGVALHTHVAIDAELQLQLQTPEFAGFGPRTS